MTPAARTFKGSFLFCPRGQIPRARRGQTHAPFPSDKAKKIRYAAVRNFGGVAMCHCPECETLHEIREGDRQLMVQNFDNGIKLEIDKQTGAAVVYNSKGAVVCRRQIVKFPELTELQLYAESL